MNSINNQIHNFSWHRIGDLCIYYLPWFGRQTLIYFGISTLFACLCMLPLGIRWQFGIFSLTWSVICMMFEFAPLVMARNNDSSRIIERMIPASALEKFAFYLLYFFANIGAVCYLMPEVAMYMYYSTPSFQNKVLNHLINLRISLPIPILILNLITVLACSITCFYTVLKTSTYRIIKAIASVFAVSIIVSLMGFFLGIYYAIEMGTQFDYTTHEPFIFESNPRIYDEIIDWVMRKSDYIWICISLLTVYLGVMLRLSYRVIHKQNL